MEESTPDQPLCHPLSKLKLLYEPMTLLQTLGEARGDRIKLDMHPREALSFDAAVSRRVFADAIAYICAYKKDPAHVTAAALERKPDEIIIWLAANGGIEEAVMSFLENVLLVINWLIQQPPDQLDEETRGKVLIFLTSRVLQFNSPKIFSYYETIMRKAAPGVFGRLAPDQAGIKEVCELRDWISTNLLNSGVQLRESDMEALAIRSYNDRSIFQVLQSLAEVPRLASEAGNLYKLLGKLGKHVVICRRLVNATIVLRQELTSVTTPLRADAIAPSPECPIPLQERKYNVDGISNRMFSDTSRRDLFRHRLSMIYSKEELERTLARKHLQKKTRVHAELLILDYFEKTRSTFLDNDDKYIGCSKPACFLCYLYIYHHPGMYTRPASHQKLYINWRFPDICQDEPNAAKRFEDQRGILERMIDALRRDLENDIANRIGKRPSLPDSTTGATPTIRNIDPDLAARIGALSFNELRQQINRNFPAAVIPNTAVTLNTAQADLNSVAPSSGSSSSDYSETPQIETPSKTIAGNRSRDTLDSWLPQQHRAIFHSLDTLRLGLFFIVAFYFFV